MDQSARVLVIAPHPDDEVLGCGGSLASHIDSGACVHVLYLTSGEHGSPKLPSAELRDRREREAVDALAVLGIQAERAHFARIPDGDIQPTNVGQMGALIGSVRHLRPGLVYLPHEHDGSFDHRMAFQLAWRALGMAASRNYPEWGTEPHWVPTVLGYEVWAAIAQPAYFADITGFLDRKLAALSCYATQAAGAKGAEQATHIGPAAAYLSGWRGASTIGGHREAFTVLRLGRLPL